MKNRIKLGMMGCLALGVAACVSTKYEQGKRDIRKPINCGTAEGDIRMLQHEKAHVEDQIMAGAKSIVPAAAVVGVVTGGEMTNISIATGDYNAKIDHRIAQIKRECGLE